MEKAVAGVGRGVGLGSPRLGEEGSGGASGQALSANRPDESRAGLAPKKALVELNPHRKRMLIDMKHPRLSVLRQCDLIGLSRSSLYYRAQGEDAYNQQLMSLLDRKYTAQAFSGWGRIAA